MENVWIHWIVNSLKYVELVLHSDTYVQKYETCKKWQKVKQNTNNLVFLQGSGIP